MGWLAKPRVTDSMAEKVRLPVAVKGNYLTLHRFNQRSELFGVLPSGASSTSQDLVLIPPIFDMKIVTNQNFTSFPIMSYLLRSSGRNQCAASEDAC